MFECNWKTLAVAFAMTALVGAAHGAVTTVGLWTLGDQDPGAISGNTVNATSIATVGPNLTALGSPVYSNDTPGSLSSLSVEVNGTDNGYYSDTLATTATDNFGVEAWVKANGATGIGTVVANGASGTGYDIVQSDGSFVGVLAGVTVFGSAAVDAGNWQQLAIVRDSGTTTLYLNGIAAGSTTANPNTPALPMTIGFINTPGVSNGDWFNGKIDNVRIFTFDAGQFNPSSDLTLSLAPTPAALPAGLGLIGALAFRRRRR